MTELISREAKILDQKIERIGDVVLENMQGFRSELQRLREEFHEQAEVVGQIWRRLVDADPAPHVNGDTPAPKHKPIGKLTLHRPHAPPKERPSLPPQLIDAPGIEVTDTGSYRIDPQGPFLASITARLDQYEREKKTAADEAAGAAKLQKQLEEKNEELGKRVKLVVAIGTGAVGFLGSCWAFYEFVLHHVH